MNHISETRALPLPLAPPLECFAKLQVLRYVIVACVAVSTDLSQSHRHRFTSIVQLCVWDWILALSDEFRMLRRNYGRPCLGYCLSGVYFVLR